VTATPTDPAGTFLGEVHVVTEGDPKGPAVALIHGLPGSVRDFRYLAPAIAACGLRAVRIDMPGFGKTPARAFPSTSLTNRAAFIHRVMRGLGHEKFALAGHSFGGGIAMHCASLFGDDVTALVCINSLGPRRHRGYRAPGTLIRASTRLLDLPLVGPRWHEGVKRAYAEWGLKSDIGLDIDVIKLHFALFGGVDFKELRVAAARVRCASLVVSSRDDPLVEPPCAFALVRALVRAPLVSHVHVESGGHFLQKHQATAIAAWLARAVARKAFTQADGATHT
jgi:pimeloyl-ACP methyl ester carboxylesterase